MIDTTEVVIQSEEDANTVLDTMKQLLETYEVVTLGDFLNLTGIASTYTDEKSGWTNLTDAKVKPVDGGFIVAFPPTEQVPA